MGDARLVLLNGGDDGYPSWTKSHQGRFSYLLESGFMSDLHLQIGKTIFRAHNLIIAAGSPIFHQKIGGLARYTVEDEIEPATFQKFLKFLYTGTCSLRCDEALPLLSLATKYVVPDLVTLCQSLLNEDFNDDIAIRIYQQAIHYGNDAMTEKAMRYVCRNAWSIIDTPGFVNLSAENLERLLKSETFLVLNETQLLHGLLRWTKEECRRKVNQEVIQTLSQLHDFVDWHAVDIQQIQIAHADIFNELDILWQKYSLRKKDTPTKQNPPRKYFVDDETSFILSRFPQKFSYCSDNKSTDVEIVKFKVDTPICLLSIGIPAYSQTSGDFLVELEIFEDALPKVKAMITERVPHSKDMHHLKFSKPFKMKKDKWYTVTGTIMGSPGYGNTGGQKCIFLQKCTKSSGSETTVKFEFRPRSISSEDGMMAGRIDEFSFKLVEF